MPKSLCYLYHLDLLLQAFVASGFLQQRQIADETRNMTE